MPLISDVTAALVGRMLDLESLRANVASRNIANANVAGYAPKEVDFQSQLVDLQQDLGQPEALGEAVEKFRQQDFTLRAEPSSSLLGAGVNLDGEVATLTVANTQYETLVESLNRHFGLMSLAITGRE